MGNRALEARIARFNRQYAGYGKDGLTPFETYKKMKKLGYYGQDVANHFGVTRQAVNQWDKAMQIYVDGLTK